MSINQRIKILIHALGLTQKLFSEKVGVSQEVISRTINGRSTPIFGFVEQVYKAFPEISPDWLLTGRGDMWKEQSKESNTITQGGKRNDQKVNVGSHVNEPSAGYGNEDLKEKIELLEKLCKNKDELIAEKERYIQLLEKSRQ